MTGRVVSGEKWTKRSRASSIYLKIASSPAHKESISFSVHRIEQAKSEIKAACDIVFTYGSDKFEARFLCDVKILPSKLAYVSYTKYNICRKGTNGLSRFRGHL